MIFFGHIFIQTVYFGLYQCLESVGLVVRGDKRLLQG